MLSLPVICHDGAFYASLTTKCERPEERKFDVDFLDYMSKNRPEIIRAAMTILRAFHCAGRPGMQLKAHGIILNRGHSGFGDL